LPIFTFPSMRSPSLLAVLVEICIPVTQGHGILDDTAKPIAQYPDPRLDRRFRGRKTFIFDCDSQVFVTAEYRVALTCNPLGVLPIQGVPRLGLLCIDALRFVVEAPVRYCGMS
jgi:hypothetical protein